MATAREALNDYLDKADEIVSMANLIGIHDEYIQLVAMAVQQMIPLSEAEAEKVKNLIERLSEGKQQWAQS